MRTGADGNIKTLISQGISQTFYRDIHVCVCVCVCVLVPKCVNYCCHHCLLIVSFWYAVGIVLPLLSVGLPVVCRLLCCSVAHYHCLLSDAWDMQEVEVNGMIFSFEDVSS